MTVDVLLQRLARVPRPELSPFWPARVTARATAKPRAARAGSLMWAYWAALLAVGGPFLLTSWERMALVVAIAMAVRTVVMLTAGTTRGRRYSLRSDVRPNSL
jgi:hypothetical protein